MKIDFGASELNELKAQGVVLGIDSVVVQHRTFLATPDGHPCDLEASVLVVMQPHFCEQGNSIEVQRWKKAYLSALQEMFFSGRKS